ncbi:ATP-binding protein [Paenibacillus sp. FSL L8-0435]|uniref:ATP-binding protein n=1 Tax=Paenibacillus TaxID=44249 RepID=UPI001F40B518|nr:ATP-binding protein [Paenibacillus xylanexedens]MCF7753049.1 ATP-binding protein [Paenibacillus xylanexedens]
MQNLVVNILTKIEDYKDYVPTGKTLFTDRNMTIKQLLSELINLFNQEEAAILAEHSKAYVTDNYEKNVRYFATQLVLLLIPEHERLKGYEDYKKLLGQRHVSYGFYSHFDSQRLITKDEGKQFQTILEDSFFEKILYLGLVDFYKNFFGKFSDNEEAIELLCKHYPELVNLRQNLDDIVTAIFHHITNAGTFGDSGFAYNGIKLISQYIGRLPIGVIHKLLKKYEIYRIVNDKVYRNQVFTIINYSCINDVEKPNYKFFFLDSLLIANYMNNSLVKAYGQNNYIGGNYDFLTSKLKKNRLGVLKYSSTEKIYTYWTNNFGAERKFIVVRKAVIHISFEINQNKIIIHNLDKSSKPLNITFKYEDWLLDHYGSLKFEQELNDVVKSDEPELIDEDADKVTEILEPTESISKEASMGNNHHLIFSMLYLNQYRGLREQLVDFDHKYTYSNDLNALVPSEAQTIIPHFYGKNIYSLSCIVGKNGAGKSSTVDFLRSTFFKLIHLIRDYNLTCINGYVCERDYAKYNILDMGCEFIIVFHLNNKTFYLTNIENIVVSQIVPFDRNAYDSNNELSKVIYFSNMLSANQDSLLVDKETTERYVLTVEEKEAIQIAESLNSFKQVDYSEAASFIRKRKATKVAIQADDNKNERDFIQPKISPVFNKDLYYQLTFLKHLTQEDIGKFFDMPTGKIFTLRSDLLNEVTHMVKQPIEDLEVFKPFLSAPDANLGPFSSGQYAKFSFHSKLYWFLTGHEKYVKDFEDVLGPNDFSLDEALLDGETALIFIDEGELYYHPEWQRNYIKTLIDSIDRTVTQTDSKLQVVITTNSPFIISDILSEDITYLSKEKEGFQDTFGQNIHKLLTQNFFMDYTIGEYSRELIVRITEWLSKRDESKIREELSHYYNEYIESKDFFKKINDLINKIGEPIYKRKLLDMLSKTEWGIQGTKALQIEALEKEMTEMNRRIIELKRESTVKE